MVQSYKNESKSQRGKPILTQTFCCDVWYKVTKMRANHNFGLPINSRSGCCDVWYKVTKMRANHNIESDIYWSLLLWCMVQSYKNESKSQRMVYLFRVFSAVMYGTKLQKWEQITTAREMADKQMQLWCMVQSYKNESKSQLEWPDSVTPKGCDVWYKVTKMRANHNFGCPRGFSYVAVMYGTKLQKWEQITTHFPVQCGWITLWGTVNLW